MVSLLPSSWPASYVRSLLEGTRVDEVVMSHFFFFLSMMLARGFALMAGTGTAVTKRAGNEGQGFSFSPR